MIVVGLGSNLGDRQVNIRQALVLLSEQQQISGIKTASLYETEPVGYLAQDCFLNTVASLETDLAPLDLLHVCLAVEKRMGRVRKERWGPRNIDIDLLLYDDVICDLPELILPHPRLAERMFVLAPLQELFPQEKVYKGKTVAELIALTKDTSLVVRYGSLDSKIF